MLSSAEVRETISEILIKSLIPLFQIQAGTKRANAQGRRVAQPGLEPESSSAFPSSGTQDPTEAA